MHPDIELIEKSDMVAGRFLNPDDQRERRKVAVIGVKVRDTLFARDAESLGETIEIVAHRLHRWSGVFEPRTTRSSEQQTIYIPLSTAQLLLPGAAAGAASETRVIGNRIERFAFTVGDASAAQTDAAIEELRAELAARKGFAPEDKQAVCMWNNAGDVRALPGAVPGHPHLRLADRPRHHPGRRGRGQQHHADLGAGAHPRDRRAQGGGRAALARSSP